MTQDENLVVRLRCRPTGAPVAEDFEVARAAVPMAGPGEVLVRTLCLSLDPALRPRMNSVSAYAGAVGIGETIPSPAIGVVVSSHSSAFAPGDHVFGFLGWQTHAVARADTLRRIDPERAPLPKWMSLLGPSSFTAYIGLAEIGRPDRRRCLQLSAAATGPTR